MVGIDVQSSKFMGWDRWVHDYAQKPILTFEKQ